MKHNIVDFNENIDLKQGVCTLYFYADWHEPCKDMNNVFIY